jgi:hypothetical protein
LKHTSQDYRLDGRSIYISEGYLLQCLIVLGYLNHPARVQRIEIGGGLAFWKATLRRNFRAWLIAKITDVVEDEPCGIKNAYAIMVDKVKDE